MKRMLCMVLVLTLILTAALSLTVHADNDEENVLIITADGENPVAVAVGNEIIYRVGLYAGPAKILDGQASAHYDPECLQIVRYEAPDRTGEYSMEAYSFPLTIYNASPVMNVENPGEVNFNFTKANGVDIFDDPSKLFAQFRFKVIAPGQTDISNVIQYMIDVDENRIYSKSQPNPEIGPYTVSSVEASLGCVGDADGDYDVTILDATLMQRAAARAVKGLDLTVADVNNDKAVSLKDAIAVRKYLAGMDYNTPVGTWLFTSEMEYAVN